MVSYLLFSQQNDVIPDEFQLVRQAQNYFRAELTFPTRQFGGTGAEAWGLLRLTIAFPADPSPSSFQARVRLTTSADRAAAEEAERVGRATGMAALARRCPVVWELDPSGHEESITLRLCALLASVFLGPILPPDRSTLFGVRGARERADRLHGSRAPSGRLRYQASCCLRPFVLCCVRRWPGRVSARSGCGPELSRTAFTQAHT